MAGHYKYFCIRISSSRKEVDYGRFTGETTQSYRFGQLIHRLVAEDVVSISKAAILAGMNPTNFRAGLEAIEWMTSTHIAIQGSELLLDLMQANLLSPVF